MPTLPAIVMQDVKDLNYWCSRFGGVPPKSADFVQKVELTGDSRSDYIVDLGRYVCKKHAAFMDGGHNGLPIRIYVIGPRGAVRLAYDDYSHGVELTSSRGSTRVWLKTYALNCGQPRDSRRVFAAAWFCLRPLEWNNCSKRFRFASLTEVRDIDRPKWGGL